MIDDKIARYKKDIETAKYLMTKRFADQGYYEDLIVKFRKILRFYEDLKVWQQTNKYNLRELVRS